MLTLENVGAGYGPTTIPHQVSLDVKQGEIVTIVGANGAGKTTTLRTIVGQIKPRAGRITFMGGISPDCPPMRSWTRGIILIPEGASFFFPDMTVRGKPSDGYLSPRRPAPRRDSRMEELDLFPACASVWTRRHPRFGGEQQMVAIARGMMANPKI